MTKQATTTEQKIELHNLNIERCLIQKERLKQKISEILINIELIDGFIYRENTDIDKLLEEDQIWCNCDLINYNQQ
jgi:hypothetical protein